MAMGGIIPDNYGPMHEGPKRYHPKSEEEEISILKQQGKATPEELEMLAKLQNQNSQTQRQPSPLDERQLSILQQNGLKNYARGGFVGMDNPELMDDLTPGTSQQMAPMPIPQQQPPAMPSVVPQMPPVAQAPVPPQSPVKLPGMPPSVTPDELEGYVNKTKGQLSKYGPDEQMAAEDESLRRRGGLVNGLVSGAKGLGDAIMMGVAGAGNPGWQQQYENQQNLMGQERLGAMQKAHEGTLQDTEASMKMDALNPSSPLSKSAQESFGSLLTKDLGIPADNVKKLSAAQMQSMIEAGLKYADIKSQGELKQATVDLQAMMGNANILNQKAQRAETQQKIKVEHPILNKLGLLPEASPSPDENFDHGSIPKGATYRAPDGTMRIKR